MSPTLSVVAGPNGSGKSTLTSSIWFEGKLESDRLNFDREGIDGKG